MSALVSQENKAVCSSAILSAFVALFVMPKYKKRGGGSSSNGSETRWGPAVILSTKARRRQADAGEQTSQSDTTNPIPGSSGTPPGVQVASLIMEQLMEVVRAHVRQEMQALSATPYHPPQTNR